MALHRYTQDRSNTTTSTSSDGKFKNNCWDASPIDGFPWLFIGSLSATENVHCLQKNNVKRILTVARRLPVSVPECIDEHRVVEVDDHPRANFLDSAAHQCKDFIDIALAAYLKNDAEKEDESCHLHRKPQQHHHATTGSPPPSILVHCASGISRSAFAILTWLMDPQRGLSLNDALSSIRKNRPAIQPNIGFMMQLQILEKHGGNLTDAITEWNSKIHGDIYERVSSRRQRANNIHAAVDELEVRIQQSRTWSFNTGETRKSGEYSSERDALMTKLNMLSDQLDMYRQEITSDTLPEDRVTQMICKSARNKIENLLSLFST